MFGRSGALARATDLQGRAQSLGLRAPCLEERDPLISIANFWSRIQALIVTFSLRFGLILIFTNLFLYIPSVNAASCG